MPIDHEGDVTPVALGRIEAAFLRGLAREGLRVVAPTELGDAQARGDACTDAACLAGIAKDVDTDHAARLVVAARGRDYTVRVTLVGVDGRESQAEVDCPICGFDEVAELAGQQAITLAGKIVKQRAPAFLSVTSEPSGALVTVDGAPFGRTPVHEELPAGEHVVKVELDGYVVRQREVVATAGVDEHVDIALEPIGRSKPRRGLVAAGGGLIGIGIASLGAGIALLVIHHDEPSGRCGDENIDVNGVCRWRYDTLAGGLVATTIGVAGVVAGAALIGVARKRSRGRPTTAARVFPSAGGVTVRF
jgi:hypothetical protein